jgi:hypothetical protein
MSKAKAKPRSLDLDEEAFLGHRAAAAADGLRASLRGRRFRATRHWAGNVADAYLFEFEDGGRLVCKVARPGTSLADEAATLSRAAAVAAEGVVPALVQVLGGGAGYLVQYVPGLSPPAYLRQFRHRRRLDPELVRALSRYHAATGQAFGDFHPENVTVGRGGVTLLDPGRPDQHGREDGEPAMVTDLGLWLHAAASNVVTYFARGPRGAWRMMKLTIALVDLGCGEAGVEPGAVLAVASRHMDDLRHSRWPRDRITAMVAARPCLWWLERRIRAAAHRRT